MKPLHNILTAAAAIAALSACSQPSSTENQIAEAPEPAEADLMEDNMATADAANPYAQAEAQMNERMMTAQGANISETFARKMIPHHAGAVEMSNVLLAQGGDEKVLAKARKTAADMQKEIGSLEQMLKAGLTGGSSTAPANPFGPVEAKMHQAMMAATGADPGETWTRKMIEHHRGAVDMANLILKQGGDPKILENARMTVDMQTKEIADLQKMLPA